MFNATSNRTRGSRGPSKALAFIAPGTPVASLAAVATLAALTALAAAPASAAAQDWQTLSQSRKYSGEKALRVDLEYAAGKLSVTPGTDATLYKADLRYDADIFRHPVLAYSNGSLKVDLSEGTVHGKNMKGGRLGVELGTAVPLDMDIKFGAVEATLDLSGMMIRNAQIHTGASQTKLVVSRPNRIDCDQLKLEVGAASFEAVGLSNLQCARLDVQGGVGEVVLDFSGKASRDIKADIQMGLGALTVRVPRGVGVQVTKDGLLASFDSQGLVKRGDAYFSENWKSAARHITLDINAAFGSIDVQWVD
jgi:hypothetical protein